jgi:hypothetical protein
MVLKGYWNEILDRFAGSPYVALLLVSSILLSVASFYTTYVGMSGFVAYSIVAAFITLGIQSLLFVTSWRIGFMLADKEPLAWDELIVFLVCFILSVFFSFVSLFDVVFAAPQQELARITRVHNGVAEAISSVGDETRERRRQLVQDMINSPEYAAWNRRVAAVADLATASKDTLNRGFTETEARRQERAGRLAAAAQEAASSAKAQERQLQEDTATLQGMNDRRLARMDEIAGLKTKLDQSKTALIELRHQMQAEERGAGKTGRPKRGVEWTRLAREQKRLLVERDSTASLLALKKDQLKALDAERQTLQARLDRTRAKQAEFDSQFAATERAAAEARQGLDSRGGGAGLNPEQAVQALRNALPIFARTLDMADFERSVTLCNHIMDLMGQEPTLAPRLARLSCDRGPVSHFQSAIDQATVALRVVERDCLVGGKNARTIDELSPAEALTYARDCLEASQLSNETVRPQRREIDRLEREESPEASPFTKTTNALLGAEKLAIVALLIALAIDLLVLFTGLVGAKSLDTRVEAPLDPVLPTDSYRARLYKYVLSSAHAMPVKIARVRYDHAIYLSDFFDKDIREVVRQFLVSNTTRGLVMPHPEEYGVFLLRHGMVDELRVRLAEEQTRGLDLASAQQSLSLAGPQERSAPWRKPTAASGTARSLVSRYLANLQRNATRLFRQNQVPSQGLES